MSVRGRLALVLSVLLLGPAVAVERSGTAVIPPAPISSEYPLVTDIRVGGDDGQTRFVADISEQIDIRAFTLANPYRVVIDMPQVTFKLPPRVGEAKRGLIKAYRFGLVMQGGSRIVIDLVRPARIEKSFVLAATNDQPARLVLDLAASDRESFMRRIALENRAAADLATRRTDRNGSDTKPSSDPRPLVVLDPGHGGIDAGTTAGRGESEKTIVLEFCLLLRDKIEKTGKYRVAMTRSDDSFVSLADRVQLARSRKASLFVSVHADALRRGVAQGATVYTLSDRASDPAAARFAEEENRADVIAGLDLSSEPDDVADILIDLARRETKAFSVQFARGLVNQLRNAAKLHREPLKSAGLRVLRAPDVPSVLVELGFVTNKEDVKSLTSEIWRARTADAVVQAVDAYFTTRLAGGQN
jgi:N-acetylmuramoyl-L-alanine amidase